MPAKGWKKKDGKEILFTFRTTTSWREAIKQIAKEQDTTTSKLIIKATQEYCDKHGFSSIIDDVRLK